MKTLLWSVSVHSAAHCLSLEEVELSLVRSHLGQQFPLLVQLLLPLRAGRRHTAEGGGGEVVASQ